MRLVTMTPINWMIASLLLASFCHSRSLEDVNGDYEYYYYEYYGYPETSSVSNEVLDNNETNTSAADCDDIVRDTNNSNLACCGNVVYDNVEYICCDGSIHRRLSSSYACCGTVAYVPNPNLTCCQGLLQPKPSCNWVCCGSSSYNVETSMCCGNSVQSKLAASYACCRTLSYDTEIQACCADGSIRWIGECAAGMLTRPGASRPGQRPGRRPRPKA